MLANLVGDTSREMAYKATLRVKGTCPTHTRFNPNLGGRMAVVGACKFCTHLCDIADAVRKADALARDFEYLKPVVTHFTS